MGSGSPVAIAIAAVAGALFVLMVGGYAYNYAKGDRGLHALPGYSFVKSKVSTEDPDKASHYSRVE